MILPSLHLLLLAAAVLLAFGAAINAKAGTLNLLAAAVALFILSFLVT